MTQPNLSILRSAFKQEEEIFETVDLSEFRTPPSTPPLILREDLYDVQFITQEEFLFACDQRIQREFEEYRANCVMEEIREEIRERAVRRQFSFDY